MPVPDDATLVVDFLNTVDIDEDVDLLSNDPEYRSWALARGLPATRRKVARSLRDALRARLVGEAAELPRVPLFVAVDAGRTPHAVVEDVVTAVLAAALALVERGEWARIKLCPNPVCLEAFYDRSKNRSRAWCDMAGCGSTMKARAYRARRRGATSSATTTTANPGLAASVRSTAITPSSGRDRLLP
ncbi:MAG: CGNR zinc finger domain-containing protein [Actinomycetota bacterium]|nr:CGNR zinc finger domain-containing protein [Actinomycetota bacterium]MDA8076677.1 CGNR zinc finger domain-containing protein [Actinomycetota bacterium]